MPVAILAVICLICAALLGAVNMIAAPEIDSRNQEEITKSLKVVLPQGENFEKIELGEKYPKEIKSAYKCDAGYVFETSVKGKELMSVMCGISIDGKVVGVEIVAETETPGYKEKVFPFVTGENGKYNGTDASSVEPEIASGATLSSNAIYSAVAAALNGHAVITDGPMVGEKEPFDTTGITDTTVEEALAIAKELTGKEYELVDKNEDMPNTVRSVFREKGGAGYAFHIATRRNKWSPIETEGIVTADASGNITAVKMLQWVVGYDSEVTDKAPEMTPEILNTYIGRSKSDIKLVDHATHATESSNAFMNAVKGALEVAYPANVYRIIGIVVAALVIVGFAAYLIVPEFIKRRKRV